jgi:hypothetical protein
MRAPPVQQVHLQPGGVSTNAKIAIGLFAASGAVLIMLLVVKLTSSSEAPRSEVRPPDLPTTTVTPRPSTPPAPVSAPAPTPAIDEVEALMATPTMKEALAQVRLDDARGEKLDEGTLMFGLWASKRMKWSDVSDGDALNFDVVMKNPAKWRGIAGCWLGRIIEIHETDVRGGATLALGGLMTRGQDVIRFIAARDTGDLIAGSEASFCGIVTGSQSYGNSAGGTTHAIFTVGMFDTPKNHLVR